MSGTTASKNPVYSAIVLGARNVPELQGCNLLGLPVPLLRGAGYLALFVKPETDWHDCTLTRWWIDNGLKEWQRQIIQIGPLWECVDHLLQELGGE